MIHRSLSQLATVAALVASAACGSEPATVVPSRPAPVTVRVATVEAVQNESAVEVRGTVQAQREAQVSSRVMGPVVAVMVRAGDLVQRGQALVEIVPETAQAQVRQAEGGLAQARAALALAERNLARFEALAATKSAAQVELDLARMQHEQALGAVTQADGAVKAAQSVAAEAVVRAPFRARVVKRWVEVGDFAAPGRPLVTLESEESRSLWLTVGERHIRQVSVGQQLALVIESRPDLGTITGPVTEIMPSAESSTHTFTVKVGLDRADIATGLTGRAWLQGTGRELLVVPTAAVHRRGGLELVVVLGEDGAARTRAVTTGSAAGPDHIEVLSGLRAGDSVVVDAAAPVADGTPLEVRS